MATPFYRDYKLPPKSIRDKMASSLGLSADDMNLALESISKHISPYRFKNSILQDHFYPSWLREMPPELHPTNGLYRYLRSLLLEHSSEKSEEDEEEDGDDEDFDSEEGEEFGKKGEGKGKEEKWDMLGDKNVEDIDILKNILSKISKFRIEAKHEYFPNPNGIYPKSRKSTPAEAYLQSLTDPSDKLTKLKKLKAGDYRTTEYFNRISYPVPVVLMIDHSGSMCSKLVKLAAAIEYFVELHDKKEIILCICLFEESWEKIIPTLENKDALLSFLKRNYSMPPGGDTYVEESIKRFKEIHLPKAIDNNSDYSVFLQENTEYIIINDGQDECKSEFSFKTHCINISDRENVGVKAKVLNSGGEYLMLESNKKSIN